MEKQYFVTILATSAKNKLEGQLYVFAVSYKHTLVSEADIEDMKREYQRILDGYTGRARKPQWEPWDRGYAISVRLSESTQMVLTLVNPKPEPEKKQ